MYTDKTFSDSSGEVTSRADEQMLAALENTLRGLRDDAIKGRAASGIESEWLEDEEYFQGIDDANRADFMVKPTSPDGRVTKESSGNKKATRSTVFVNITRPYVNAASAKVADMLLPTDDSNYGMRPTPIPDLVKKSLDVALATNADGSPVMKSLVGEDGQPVMQSQMDASGQPVMAPVRQQATVGDVVKHEMQQAKEACEKANQQIDDWLVQCGYHGEVRQVIEDAARIGTGVLKGPYPDMFRRRAVVKAMEGIGIVIKEEIAPKSRCVSVWNIYPDPSCGESIQNGKYIFEYDTINARQLQDLKRTPGYLPDAIDRIVKEGPKNSFTGNLKRQRNDKPNDKEQFDIWYYHGYLSRTDLANAGYQFDEAELPEEEDNAVGLIDAPQEEAEPDEIPGEEMPPEMESAQEDAAEGYQEEECCAECGCAECACDTQYPAIVTIVNDTIIKATLSPLDSGEFPYDVMPWQRRSGSCWGIGVSRQMRTSQDGVNAGARNMMDNAGLSSGPILIFDRSKIQPADGDWMLKPRKVFYTTDNFDGGNVRDAITEITINSHQQELLAIIQFWMQRAEDETGLPMLLQGQLGKAPDTVGGMTMLNNNASSVLRRIARIFDDRVTEPHIGRYYEWLLLHGEDDSMKGDFTIEARGSSALVERDAHAQALMQLTGASANPVFGLDPELVMKEMLKSQRFDAEKLSLSDDKKQEMAQRQPPQDPRIAVAQINAQAKGQQLQAMQAFDAQEAEKDRQLELVRQQIIERVQAMKDGTAKEISLIELKGMLASTSAKLHVQKDLSVADHMVGLHKHRTPQVLTPPTEPAGRALPGQAFQA